MKILRGAEGYPSVSLQKWMENWVKRDIDGLDGACFDEAKINFGE